MKKLIGAVMLLLASISVSAQTQVPHTFQAGQPASAAEVNANFDSLESAIEQNASSIFELQQVSSFSWMGVWQTGVSYSADDLVEFQGSTYLAVQNTDGTQNPSDTGFWSLFAAAGAIGPQGSVGPRGAPGPQGETGPMGPQGLIGNTGPQGPIGPAGPQGPQGAIGPQGDPGPMGPAGPQGPQGEQGLAGPTGTQGQQGDAGPIGPTGPQGAIGPQGDPGPAGPSRAIPVFVVDGVPLGTVIKRGGGAYVAGEDLLGELMTDTGFLVRFSVGNLRVEKFERMYFMQAGCTGQLFVEVSPNSFNYLRAISTGQVASSRLATDNYSLYFIPPNEPTVTVTPQSYMQSGLSYCSGWGAGQVGNLFPAYPNDPSVTGVSSTSNQFLTGSANGRVTISMQ